jgi:hypothetical protein
MYIHDISPFCKVRDLGVASRSHAALQEFGKYELLFPFLCTTPMQGLRIQRVSCTWNTEEQQSVACDHRMLTRR